MAGEGRGPPGVPFRSYPVGCCVGRIGLIVYVSAPHCNVWVRGLQCAGLLLCFGAGGRRRGSPRTRFVARLGPSSVFPSLCHANYVMYPRKFFPR